MRPPKEWPIKPGLLGVLVAPPEGRMGVEDLVAVAQEAAMTRHLGGLLTIEQALTESLRRFRKRGNIKSSSKAARAWP